MRNAFLCLAEFANNSNDEDARLAGLESAVVVAAALGLDAESKAARELESSLREVDFWRQNLRDASSTFNELLKG